MISKRVFTIVFIVYTFALGLKFTFADFNQYEYKIVNSASQLVDIAEKPAVVKVKVEIKEAVNPKPQDLVTALSIDTLESDVFCLARNVYHEARSQGTAGRIAVAMVTLNRVADLRFPDSICGVVTQGPHRPSWKDKERQIPLKNRCHFSWYCDGAKDDIKDLVRYAEIEELSRAIILNYDKIRDITDGATHYHAYYVTPEWAATKTKTTVIEDHHFYRWEKRQIDLQREKEHFSKSMKIILQKK
ncbi:uncharacterized protein METZ01_LOCUS181106 [marine metagenome]|uniref:Cell wall hydrolase SleB domain-containing protein n=1 Tax=marine metagenome TaxID=408172 RepID=A0A382CR14_9ZZZZ